MPMTRRAMLGLLSSSTFLLTASRGQAALPELPAQSPRVSFPQGVASGDPQPDAVMLWTRALPEGDASRAHSGQVPLLLQLSGSSDFSTPLLQAELTTSADSDYTVRAYVDGLDRNSRAG